MKKGYLETVAENHFKTLEDGTRVFYAQGPLGRRGFAVPTPELESDLKRATRTYYLWFIISCGLIGVLVGPLSRGIDLYASILQIVFATVIAYVITCSYFRRYTKSLEAVAGSPNSTLEHWRRLGKETKPWLFWSLSVSVLVFTVGGFALYSKTGDPILLASAIISLVICIP